MRRLALAIALVGTLAIAGTATARSNNRLHSFGTGDVSISGSSATIANDPGEYGGVYLKSRSLSSKPLRAVHISFRSTGDVGGGAPRFSIPLNTGHAESVTPYAFIDVNNCGSNWVSTENPDCKVFLNFSSEFFDNWADLVATHPKWRIAKAAIPFIIADVTGHYAVTDIDLR
jgi:hypothetical protein